MAKLKATPKNYAEALAVLAGRESVRLGNNTYLEHLNGLQFIGVRLHSTYIVRFHENGTVTLHTGGYYTVTTKERINHFVLGSVWQSNHQWFYHTPATGPLGDMSPKTYRQQSVEFEEGLAV
jgi:hypothetical protein